MTPELQAAADAAIAKAVKAYQIAVNGLTEQQTCEAFKQAIACQDFVCLIEPDYSRQTVVYIPFRREQELRRRIHNLRASLIAIAQYREPLVSLKEVQAIAQLALSQDGGSPMDDGADTRYGGDDC